MTTAFSSALIAHIFFGIIGLALLQYAFMQIIRTNPPYRIIPSVLFFSVSGFLLSWATGAFYYVVHYGAAVKPRILAGAYPWAHQVGMESKEHIFLLIPFLVAAVWFSSLALRSVPEQSLKTAAATAAAVALTLGGIVAAAGIIISGALR